MNRSFSFFRQSAWMFFATQTGGALMALVHRASEPMGEGEYGQFTWMVNSLQTLAFPSLGLAAVFAQMAAIAKTEQERRDVAAAARWSISAMIGFWLLLVAVAVVTKNWLTMRFGLSSPFSLVWMISALFLTLVTPVMLGLVQGQQNFLAAGLGSLAGGAGRLVFVLSAVWLIRPTADWAMCGVFLGLVAAILPMLWGSLDLLRLKGGQFRFGQWFRDTLPLTAGLTASTLLFTMDMWASQGSLSPADKDSYGAAATVARVVMWVSAPMVLVMFPKIAASAGTGEDRRVLFLTVGATALAAGGAAVVCTLFPALPLLVLQGKKLAGTAAPLVPQYVWCLLPLALANVLLNNLLARKRYWVVVPLGAVVLGYWLALQRFHDSPQQIIWTMGGAATAALMVCVLATWIQPKLSSTRTP